MAEILDKVFKGLILTSHVTQTSKNKSLHGRILCFGFHGKLEHYFDSTFETIEVNEIYFFEAFHKFQKTIGLYTYEHLVKLNMKLSVNLHFLKDLAVKFIHKLAWFISLQLPIDSLFENIDYDFSDPSTES